jgi:membrane peptidoglycan carboxypeptidase
MRLLPRLACWFLVAILASAVAFDVLVVLPAVSRVKAAVANSHPDESSPPSSIVEMLDRAYGSRLQQLVVRQVVHASQIEGLRITNSRRQLTELGLSLLLPLHVSRHEMQAAFLSQAYMGPDVTGFAAASKRYFGSPLQKVSREQAARLVAITHAPSIYLASPERLEKRAKLLLSTQAPDA